MLSWILPGLQVRSAPVYGIFTRFWPFHTPFGGLSDGPESPPCSGVPPLGNAPAHRSRLATRAGFRHDKAVNGRNLPFSHCNYCHSWPSDRALSCIPRGRRPDHAAAQSLFPKTSLRLVPDWREEPARPRPAFAASPRAPIFGPGRRGLPAVICLSGA